MKKDKENFTKLEQEFLGNFDYYGTGAKKGDWKPLVKAIFYTLRYNYMQMCCF